MGRRKAVAVPAASCPGGESVTQCVPLDGACGKLGWEAFVASFFPFLASENNSLQYVSVRFLFFGAKRLITFNIR